MAGSATLVAGVLVVATLAGCDQGSPSTIGASRPVGSSSPASSKSSAGYTRVDSLSQLLGCTPKRTLPATGSGGTTLIYGTWTCKSRVSGLDVGIVSFPVAMTNTVDDQFVPGAIQRSFGSPEWVQGTGWVVLFPAEEATLSQAENIAALLNGAVHRVAPSAAPTPPWTPGATVLSLSGNGSETTTLFDAAPTWTITYNYDCASPPANFALYPRGSGAADGAVTVDNSPEVIGGGTEQEFGPGSYQLEIDTLCVWTVVVRNS